MPKIGSPLDQVHQIRVKNNDLWMEILQIALDFAPEETKAILARIKKNDRRITELFGALIDE